MKTSLLRTLAVSAALLSVAATSEACTDFRLTAKDGTYIVTRTMEFAQQLNSNLRSSPRGREFNTTTMNEKPGMSWKGKYGYLYLDGFGMDVTFDGINEQGLSFGYLYMPGDAAYQAIPDGKDAQALPYIHFGDWVLSNFKTIDEVKAALQNIYVVNTIVPQLGKLILPAHASIYDASGKGIVVEFYDDKIHINENLGVLTNSPRYEWHITNLRNYLNLTPYIANALTVEGTSFAATGQGSGAVGLPGDASPPSRFVKTAFMAKYVYMPKTAEELLNLAQHVVNNVDLPAGLVRSEYQGKTTTDTTQWTVFKDLTHKKIYYRTYNDMTLRVIDISKIDFTEKATPLKMPLVMQPYMMEITDKFKSSTK